MRLAISGTPGTGKTQVAKKLARELNFKLIDINKFAREKKLILGYDKKRKTSIVDVTKLKRQIKKLKGNFIIEGHLAHFCPADIVIVLRCNPQVLTLRLKKAGWPTAKIAENVEAEILDVCLQEAVAQHGLKKVFEIDTTKKKPQQAVQIILKLLKGKGIKKYSPGGINWTRYLEKLEV